MTEKAFVACNFFHIYDIYIKNQLTAPRGADISTVAIRDKYPSTDY
jgi:hypothetical protein